MLFVLSIAGFIQINMAKGLKGTMIIALLCSISVAALCFLSSVYACVISIAYIVTLGLSAYHKHQSQNFKRWYAVLATGAIITVFILCVLFIKPDRFMFGTNFISTDYKSEVIREVLSYAKFIGSTPMRTHSATGYALATVIGTYGWLAGIGIVLAFALLLTLMVRRSLKVGHPYGRLLAFGISAFFSARFVLFLLANLGVISGTSVNLPFVSYGSINLITDLFLAGVFLSVWRRSSFMTKDTLYEPKGKHIFFRAQS